MIVTKTPLRISFFGGGSDLPEYYSRLPGAVLSAAIDVNMFITINESPKQRIKACYDEIELVETTAYLKHNRIRESLLYYNIHNNLEVSSFCHIPTKGTGLGSSSTYTVGLCNALNQYTSTVQEKHELADTAYFIERELCNEKLGKQDQYAAAFGGLNLIEFTNHETAVRPVLIKSEKLQELENNLMFFYTGVTRVANDILSQQAKKIEGRENDDNLSALVDLAIGGYHAFQRNDIKTVGSLLDYSWEIKKRLSAGVTNSQIDELYDRGRKAGALGGKILGAGGGGFIMFYVEEKDQERVRQAMSDLKEYKFKFSRKGSEVVYAD